MLVTTRVIDPVLWTGIRRSPLMQMLREAREHQSESSEAFERRRSGLLAGLLTHAITRIPYHAERVPGLTVARINADPIAALREFPPLTKSDLQAHLEELKVEMGRGTFLDASGGSTGSPTRFYHDRDQLASSLAATQVFFEWAGVARGERHAKLWGARRDLGARDVPALRLKRFFYGRTTVDAFDMGATAMAEYVKFLQSYRPVCIEGYADALHTLAEFVAREGLDIPRPRSIVSSASTLTQEMRARIEAVFQAPVFDRYGGREAGAIAAECSQHAGMHVAGEAVHVEILRDDGTQVAVGEEGDVLVTCLRNYTMPLIRYRVGDRAIRGEDSCPCGRPYPLIARIIGRSSARIVRRDGGMVVPEFFIHTLGVEYNEGDIKTFQVVQEDLDSLLVRVVPHRGAEGRVLGKREEIASRFQEAMGAPCRVTFSLEQEIPPTATGKFLYTISKVALAEERGEHAAAGGIVLQNGTARANGTVSRNGAAPGDTMEGEV